MKEQIFQIVEDALNEHKRAELKHVILGIIQTESSFRPEAGRFEPDYKWLVKPKHYAKQNGITVDTEIVFQKTSWGLMQVMGAVYRELGYPGALNMLSCDIEKQIRYGIRHFLRMFAFYGDINRAILGYNRGFGVKHDDVKLALLDRESYLNKVLRHSEQFIEV